MSGLSDLAQNIGADNKKVANPFSVSNLATSGTYGAVKVANRLDGSHIKNDHQVLTGATQKKEQLQSATDQATALKAQNDAQIASDAAEAEKKRIAGIMPVADDAAAKADQRRRIAASASAGGRQSTILSGQRLGD